MPKMGILIHDGIGPILAVMAGATAVNVGNAMEEGKEQLEAYAKSNAPWTDRTGQARNGLQASVYNDGGIIVLELAQTVEHGRWLELIQDGHFAIIMPTIEALGPQIIRDAGGRVLDVGGF